MIYRPRSRIFDPGSNWLLGEKFRSQEAIQQAKRFDPLGQCSGYYSQGYGVNGAKCCILAISRDLI